MTRTNSQGSAVVPARQSLEETPGIVKQWKGVRVVDDQATARMSYHGVSSAAYFTARIDRYIKQELQGPCDERHLQPNTASSTFALPTKNVEKGTQLEYGESDPNQLVFEELGRPQEQLFLNLFWQSYHCLNPLLSQTQFSEHYDSLWQNLPQDRPSTRRSSALVDIILANCMQYGITFLFPRDDITEPGREVGSEDASIAGQGFYARCQQLLEYDLETPTITTLQCLVFSIMYLWNASFINRADNTLAMAVRMAYMLGLNHEPCESIAPDEQDLHRLLWWTLYLFDTQIGISLGRPFLISVSTSTCNLPQFDLKSASQAVPRLALDDSEISLYDYSIQSVKLAQAIRVVYAAFNERSSELVHSFGVTDMQEDPKVMESLASLLYKATRKVKEWAENVPELLWSTRAGSNEPFTAHRSALSIDLHQPPWLQRQRVNLILLYHEFMMGLFRPFIRIPPTAVSLTPVSDGHSISCLNHAMAITSITHQILHETDILNGCHSVYRTQWNATLSILGFILGNPVCPPTPSARKALQTTATIFDTIGSNLASAASAAHIVRNMTGLAQQLIQKFRNSLSPSSSSHSSPQSQQTQTPGQRQQQSQQQQKMNGPSGLAQQQQQVTTQDFQSQQQSRSLLQPQGLALPFSALPINTELLPNLSSSPTVFDQLSHQTANEFSQWPTTMSMDITTTMSDPQLQGVQGSLDPWPEFMTDVQSDSADQPMDRWQ